jgi:hypothetical protein
MQLKHHKTLNLERWRKFSLAEQLGNVGSEVGRLISAKKKGDEKLSNSAFERAVELIDLTIMDKKHNKRLREIGRLREVFIDAFLGGSEYRSNLNDVNKYLLDFALLARK